MSFFQLSRIVETTILEDYGKQKSINFFGRTSLANFRESFARLALKQ